MDPIWFNMYGIRPKEKQAGATSLLHASAFMGRILMSFHLNSDERPKLLSGSQIPAASKDKSTSYILWIDCYEIVNCDDLYDAHVEPSTFEIFRRFIRCVSKGICVVQNNCAIMNFSLFVKSKTLLDENRPKY